jgi:hypothetical protein
VTAERRLRSLPVRAMARRKAAAARSLKRSSAIAEALHAFQQCLRTLIWGTVIRRVALSLSAMEKTGQAGGSAQLR